MSAVGSGRLRVTRKSTRWTVTAILAAVAVPILMARHSPQALRLPAVRLARGNAQVPDGQVTDAAEVFATLLQREPENLSAAFNWASVLERLGNRPGAIAAWRHYVDLEVSPERKLEAKHHLDLLTMRRTTWEEARLLLRPGVDRETVKRVVAEFPQRVRMRSQNVLLPAWAESGRPEELAVVRAIAEERAGRDPYLLDIVTNAEKNQAAVASGLRAFARGFDVDNHRATARASAGVLAYSEAADLLGQAGSPLAIGAEVYAASMADFGGESEDAVQRIAIADRHLAEAGGRYPAIAAESAWVRAIALMHLGEMQRSLDDLRRARVLALRAGETENAAFIAAMIATDMELLIDPAEAVSCRIDALHGLEEIRADVKRIYPAYFESGYMALRNGHPHVAMAYLESAAELARRSALLDDAAVSTAQRALALWQTGREERAAISLDTARRAADGIEDPAVRARAMAEIDYVRGTIALPKQPREAMAAFRSAIEFNRRYNRRLFAAAAYVGCGEAALAAGDHGQAEQNFRNGIAEMEFQRNGIDDQAMRAAYFDRADQAFERLIDLLLTDGRTGDALAVAERKRARVLLDQISGSRESEPLDAGAIIAAVGKGQALLELTLLDDGARMWLVHDGHVVEGRSTASRSEIEKTVRHQLAAIAADDEAGVKADGRWLYAQLIAPVAAALPPDVDLAIAADGVLHNVPFPALVSDDGRYLIEQRVVAVAPSASIFFRSRRDAAPYDSLLAVAQPNPPGLDPLPSARSEVERTVRLYRHGRLFVGREIDPAGFLDAARDASLVHFAGHARTDFTHPSRSALLFESSGETPAPLTAETIGRSRFDGHPLVVLSACGTGRGRVRRNEGIDSLAGAFLRAGARGVVATLWDVDDTVSSELFRRFHQRLRQGARAADALREAQLSLLHGDDAVRRQPAAWAGTVVIGSF